MNKPIALLLATTALTQFAAAPARAGTIVESVNGTFGSNVFTPTTIPPSVTEIVGNVDHYSNGYSNGTNTPDFFDIQTSGFRGFQLVFNASQVGLDAANGSYYPLDFATTNSGATVTPLAPYYGTNVLTSVEGNTLALSVLTGSGSGTPVSGAVYPTSLDPILTFYGASGNLVESVDIENGISVTLAGVLDGSSNLLIGVNTPFDYTLGVALVPEPASVAVLGLGAAALLAARRRKRVI